MLTIKQLELLEIWLNHPFQELSIAEIMHQSRRQTKTWVFNTLQRLTGLNLLTFTKKSNINLYKLNFDYPLALQMLHFLEIKSCLSFPQMEPIAEILKKAPITNFSLLVFGSYAESKQTKNSDLDLCFIVENKEGEKDIKPYLNEIKLNYSLSIDDHYITFNDFVAMLLNEEENLGKQIFRKHKLLYNADIYYKLIYKAYKHGFRP